MSSEEDPEVSRSVGVDDDVYAFPRVPMILLPCSPPLRPPWRLRRFCSSESILFYININTPGGRKIEYIMVLSGGSSRI